MAKSHDKLDPNSSQVKSEISPLLLKTTRHLKVRKGHYHHHYADFHPRTILAPEPVPWLYIKGYWLKEAGFPVGATVKVTVEDKRLVIELDEAPVLTDLDKFDASLREAAKGVREREFEKYKTRKLR